MISKDTISLVRDRTDIVAVITESVPSLKKRGRRFVGLCPFHKEKTPSFHVNPDVGLYHCFGCKESGDAFRFLERVEGYTFAEAVRALAERAGIPIEEDRSAPSVDDAQRHKKERDALYAAMQIAATWYESQLREHPQRSFAIGELARRGVDPSSDAAKEFRLGYAPSSWEGLFGFLKKQGVSPAVAESVGLVVPRSSGSGYYDRFRHRLMFSVHDGQGRVVAFSGRALPPVDDVQDVSHELPKDVAPKYINSPESPIYVKGATLFGLWQARHAIRQTGRALLVEGNFDAVSLHARGLQNVIAPLGTSFTVDQAKLLRRYTVDVTLLFDGDAAGRKAARAAEDPCEQAGLEAKVALLPEQLDPDEFIRSRGSEALRDIVNRARGLLEYLIDVELDDSFNAADLRERTGRIERVAALLARQKDPVVRGMLKAYADYAASRLDLVRSAPNAFGALERKVVTAARAARVAAYPRPSEARVKHRTPGYEERKAIVGALLDFPVLVDDFEVRASLGALEGESARIVSTLGQCIRISERGEKALDPVEFLAQLPPPIQAFASARLAAPEHDTVDEARTAVIANMKKLRETNVARETRETVREQHRVVGDWETEVELARHVDALVRQRQGLIRR
ncbi:MAG TPA: DNA primase [Polyangiaceae bacterium]|nr:DNA primase [Polyangiaceae bacterium]